MVSYVLNMSHTQMPVEEPDHLNEANVRKQGPGKGTCHSPLNQC